MRRAFAGRQQVGVSLFPFLAVLICTMGALIVLLVLVVKQAEVQAHEQHAVTAEEAAERRQRLRTELEDQEFLRRTLSDQRPLMTQQLTEQRLRLSHLEDHIRQLSRRAQQLEKQLQDVQQIEQIRRQDRGALEASLAQLRAEIAAAQEQLEQAQTRARKQRRSFAIVPYEGPNGTRRRPIYIECTAEAVIIQPEGVKLRPGDFQEPLVPGNPLDAALLAVREYLSRSGIISSKNDEPYPLLIVRPGGATSYSKARAAMKSWDDEFGYELVGADMRLEYPPADAALERVLRQAIREARVRQSALAAAQPSRFQRAARGSSGRTVLRASRRGGFTRERVDDRASWSAQSTPAGDAAGSANQTARNSKLGAAEPATEFQQHADPDVVKLPGQSNSAGPVGYSGQQGQGQGALAASHGADWALPSKAPGATAYTRPIRVVCFADQLVIVPATGSDQRPLITRLGKSTRESMNGFVTSIWQHMESWGIAGRNAYWKPVLHVDVRPGGERRFAEMEVLLKRSGLVVQRAAQTP